MTPTSFTLAQATDIAEDFDDLIGTKIKVSPELVWKIDGVFVCPFNEDDKKMFAEFYQNSGDENMSIDFYKGDEYDVIIFAFNVEDKNEYTVIPIRDFIDFRGINYNFPE